MAVIRVNSPSHPYSIHIATGLLVRLGESMQREVQAKRVLLAVDANIAQSHGAIAEDSLRQSRIDLARCELFADERQKSLAAAQRLYEVMASGGLDRAGAVIALGGGIVGDIAGFAAATYMRGVRLVHVPSTLLAMVDASIGGKTAVNLVREDGSLIKNLIGAFWQPALVLVDPQLLLSLNQRDFRCGLAECIKHAMIADRALLDFIRANCKAIVSKELSIVQELIERTAAVKVAIVARDEHERGERALLNLGHTFAHAIESCAELDIRHGEAVSIGLCAASWLSAAQQKMPEVDRNRIVQTVQQFGLPTRLPMAVESVRLIRAMRHDKKSVNQRLRLVLPLEIGSAQIVDDVSEDMIGRAWESVGAV